MTIAHLRTYTINKGQLDSWLELFPKLIPLMEEANIKVECSWVNEERTQFIWIRSYGDSIENIATLCSIYTAISIIIVIIFQKYYKPIFQNKT